MLLRDREVETIKITRNTTLDIKALLISSFYINSLLAIMKELVLVLLVLCIGSSVANLDQEPVCGYHGNQLELLMKLNLLESQSQTAADKLKALEERLASRSVLQQTGPVASIHVPLTVAELEVNGWHMVFRAASGNGQSVYDAWIKGSGVTDVKPVTMERTRGSHYRDKGVGAWSSSNILYVKVALYKQDREVAYIIFNGKGSNYDNWFAKERVIDSSWSDVTNQGEYNIFAMYVAHNHRYFYISRQHGGCSKDLGFFVVKEKPSTCEWEEHPTYPQFQFSDTNGATVWQKRDFAQADFLAFFVHF